VMGLLAHCVHWTMLQSGRSNSCSQPVDVIRLRIVPSFTVRMTFNQGVPGSIPGGHFPRAATARFGRVEAKPVLVRLITHLNRGSPLSACGGTWPRVAPSATSGLAASLQTVLAWRRHAAGVSASRGQRSAPVGTP